MGDYCIETGGITLSTPVLHTQYVITIA